MLPRHKQFIKERQYVNNVSPATITWHEQSLCWLDTESPSSDDIKDLIIRLRERGLEPISIRSRVQAVSVLSVGRTRGRHTEDENRGESATNLRWDTGTGR